MRRTSSESAASHRRASSVRNQDHTNTKLSFDDGFQHWRVAQGVTPGAKVFICSDKYPDLANALCRRGWTQNNDERSEFCNLRWSLLPRGLKGVPGDMLINHCRGIEELCRKTQLYNHLRDSHLCADINAHSFLPRVFDLSRSAEVEAFQQEFYISAAEMRLKQFVSGEGNNGTGAAAAVLRRHLLAVGAHEDEQQEQQGPFYISSDEAKRLKDGTGPPVESLEEAQVLLSRRAEVEGAQSGLNVANWWVLKPGDSTRSFGIQVVDDLDAILRFQGSYYVVQKYIERPLLINGWKSDIRQLVLVKNWRNLEAYFFKGTYCRFAAETYDPADCTKAKAHITNRTTDSDKQSFTGDEHFNNAQLEAHVDSHFGEGKWHAVVEEIKRVVIATLLCVQEELALHDEYHPGGFELLGYDMELDEDLHVWLLEVNEMPSLEYTTPTKEVIVKGLLEDCAKVLVDSDGKDIGSFERLVFPPHAAACEPVKHIPLMVDARRQRRCYDESGGPRKDSVSEAWFLRQRHEADRHADRQSDIRRKEQKLAKKRSELAQRSRAKVLADIRRSKSEAHL